MKNTILITGATGYIGTHLTVQLLKKHVDRYDLVLIGRTLNSSLLDRIKQMTHVKPNFEQIDLLNFTQLKGIFTKYKINAVIHLAGTKAGTNTLDYYTNNIIGSLHLLKCCDEFHVDKIIFASSASVYGHNVDTPIKEDSHIQPTNVYGRTKSMIETILQDVSSSSRIIILRCFNPIGAHVSGLIGEVAPNHIVPCIAQVLNKTKPHVTIFGNDYKTPDGTAIRDYIHIVDLAEGFVAALDRLFLDNIMVHKCEIYNLGSGIGHSVLELLAVFEKNIPYQCVKRKTGDVAILVASTEKAMRELLWTPHLSIQQACEDALRFHTKTLTVKPN